MMDEEKKVAYDKTYIEELYLRYLAAGQTQEVHKTELRKWLRDKKIVIIGPGKSSVEEKDKIVDFAMRDDVVAFSINCDYDYCRPDFIFISNLRRFRELNEGSRSRCIVTSNIPGDGVYYQVKYRDLLNTEDPVRDNAVLMLIKFLIIQGVKEVYLVGIDGYSHDVRENYGRDDMAFFTRNAVLDAMNIGMRKVLRKFSEEIRIQFLSTPRFVFIDRGKAVWKTTDKRLGDVIREGFIFGREIP